MGDPELIEPEIEYCDDLDAFGEPLASAEQMSNAENNVDVHEDTGGDAESVLQTILEQDPLESPLEETSDDDEEIPAAEVDIVSHRSAYESVERLVRYAATHSPDLVERVLTLQNDIEKVWATSKRNASRQAAITEYFAHI
jgi:hypothetical protein